MSRIQMWNQNGNRINLNSYGLFGLALIPESPSYDYQLEKVPGAEGVIPLGKDLNARNLVARFLVQSFDYTDSLVKTDQIYDLLNGSESFYIGETNQPGKRWLVDSVEPWSPERYNKTTLEMTLNLMALSGLAESVNMVEKTYTENTFKFNNKGTKEINPRSQTETEIIFKGISTNLKIKNKTTNEEWSYVGSTTANDEILLKGIRSTKNNLSVFRDTNKKIITFAPSWNEFEIIGASAFEITIRTRFYFY